ncbi:unnamed protein product [Acanthoscelides obtectus]|uniref:Uncharacterized protein n=1 Tax=Acanthoscelides obtectus TaxID=200917 RepID=A0A9P0ML12_ACAOB|nr:unnamed protein product [Acanthoscelides obtectus]CAK1670100.1 hypothetical protein AOBTE_LOCUS27401 [Acanthoscelides obtectus]
MCELKEKRQEFEIWNAPTFCVSVTIFDGDSQ